jgi:glutaredoxin 3
MEALIYTTTNCPFCTKAKSLLAKLAISYTEKVIASRQDPARAELKARMQLSENERLLVPQIWIDNSYVGGFDRLQEWSQRLTVNPN